MDRRLARPVHDVAGHAHALELSATYLGLLKNKVEHSGGIDLVKRLQAARQRGRAA